ncbi:recombinase family protein [Streptomyces sp. ISL-111]|uniref:recombinase family protein n=1 Tax=Streptomyces sp. ISL-111 TaxID=2819175 RepID=UPI001BE53CDE|nr:recombinase family protein [Streptomyces sp. ISL-111]MBT2381088.1 recombinase family protein [Streptomyces sp. ISL-111]
MEREDLPALRALGFDDDDLKELGLWIPAVDAPADLAEMYVRRSKKKDSLSALREQVRRMCAHAASEGKTIRHVWFEQRSASKSYVRREEFEQACAAIVGAGLSKTLYVFKTSRLSRRGMGQVGLLLDELEEIQARIYVVAEHIDSTRSRFLLSLFSEQAREQVADLSQFVKLGMDAHKADGKWTGGVTPFGLRSAGGRLEHDPKEYPLARRIAEYLLDRKTPNWIANTLNVEGKLTRHGKKWSGPGIISLAHAVTWAGLVAQRERQLDAKGKWNGKYHRGGSPLMDKNGHPISCGEGVITFAEHVKIKSILSSRSQKGTSIGDRTRGKREIVALLSASLRCGRCAGPMANGGVNYRCYARQTEGESSCQGVATDRARVDSAVETLWINHVLSLSPESDTLHAIAKEWLSYKDPAKEARKIQVTAALESAVGREIELRKERFLLGRMSEADYEYLWRELNAQIDAHKAELATLSVEADLSPLMDPEAVTALWNGAGIGGQRALLKAALTEKGIVLAAPRYRGDRTPILDRLTVHWRDESDPAALAAMDAGMEFVERTRQRRTT